MDPHTQCGRGSAERRSSDDENDVSDASDALEPADIGADADCPTCSCCCDLNCPKCFGDPDAAERDRERDRRWQEIVAAQEADRRKRAAELAEWAARKAKDPSPKGYRRKVTITVSLSAAEARKLLKRKGLDLETVLKCAK